MCNKISVSLFHFDNKQLMEFMIFLLRYSEKVMQRNHYLLINGNKCFLKGYYAYQFSENKR